MNVVLATGLVIMTLAYWRSEARAREWQARAWHALAVAKRADRLLQDRILLQQRARKS